MSVGGFGANAGEVKEQKVVPDKLMAYRMFRFQPEPGGSLGVSCAWESYENGNAWRWKPCLTAASYGESFYDRPGEYTAMCKRTPFDRPPTHSTPHKNCACGFWAYYAPDVIDTGSSEDWLALAAVKVWGDVVLGDKGVRAQYMEIVGLRPPSELANASGKIVQTWTDLCTKLKVPYFWAKSELLTFFPPQDVSELIPKEPEPEPEPEPGHISLGRNASPSMWQKWIAGGPAGVLAYTYYVNNSTSVQVPGLVQTYTHQIGSATCYECRCSVCGASIVSSTESGAQREIIDHISTHHYNQRRHAL